MIKASGITLEKIMVKLEGLFKIYHGNQKRKDLFAAYQRARMKMAL
jgi:hypothetical protein